MPKRIEDVSQHVPVRQGDWDVAGGRVRVTRAKFGPLGSTLLRVVRISPTMTITLDELGSTAWQAMDGRDVAGVLQDLRVAFPGEDDLGPRLGQFLSTMVSNGLVQLRSSSR